MLDLLSAFNYNPPNIIDGKYGNIEISHNGYGYYYLLIDEKQWMAYDVNTHLEAFEVYSHYQLAEGNVVVTGLGFGARENWILSKKEVTKLTIIEKSKELINLHHTINSEFLNDKRVEIVNIDAIDYEGDCDILLLDHYELDDYNYILADVKKIQDKINCKQMWFWPFERIIMHSRRWHSFNDSPYNLITKHQAFNLLKENWGLDKLPNYSEQKINLFCMMFHSKLFSNSEWILNECFQDRKLYEEIYRCI